MGEQTGEHEEMVRFGNWPSTTARSGQWAYAAARVACDPEMSEFVMLAAPNGDEDVLSLRACLRRAPHITRVFWPQEVCSGWERWLAAVPMTVRFSFDHSQPVNEGFAHALLKVALRNVYLIDTQQTLIEAIEASTALDQLEWFCETRRLSPGTDVEALELRMMSVAARAKSAKLWLTSAFSARMAAVFVAATSETLSRLKVAQYSPTQEAAAGFAPLWRGLSTAPRCELHSLSLRSAAATGIEVFLASPSAREHLAHLKLELISLSGAPLVLSLIVRNLGVLTTLDISFAAATESGDANAFAEATRSLEEQRQQQKQQNTRVGTLSTFAFAARVWDDAASIEEAALLHAFLGCMADASACLHAARFFEPGTDWHQWHCSHAVIAPMVRVAHKLGIAFTGLSTAPVLFAALRQNACIEELHLTELSESLLGQLAGCLEATKSMFLKKLHVATRSTTHVSEATFVRICDALRGDTLEHLELSEKSDEDDVSDSDVESDDDEATVARKRAAETRMTARVAARASDTCASSLDRLIWRAPALQQLHIAASVVARNTHVLRDAVLAHGALEKTNLLFDDEGHGPMMEARRLQRHRLAAHWAQSALLIAFGRAHPVVLRSAVVPFLESTLASAGLALPREAWAKEFSRSLYFRNCCSSSASSANRKRKRALPPS